MDGVAEVDDPAYLALVIEQDVVEGQIAVDGLGAKARPSRRHAILVAVEHGLDQAAAIGVGYLLEVLPEARRLRQGPEQFAARRGVEEPAQGEVQPRMGRAVGADRVI